MVVRSATNERSIFIDVNGTLAFRTPYRLDRNFHSRVCLWLWLNQDIDKTDAIHPHEYDNEHENVGDVATKASKEARYGSDRGLHDVHHVRPMALEEDDSSRHGPGLVARDDFSQLTLSSSMKLL